MWEMVIETLPPELVGTGLDYLFETLQPILKTASIVLGGVFGVYLLLLFARVYYERKKVRLLEDIRYDLDKLNIHYGVHSSKQRRRGVRKLMGWLKKIK